MVKPRLYITLALFLALGSSAMAQHVLVQTTTLSVSRERVGTFLQSVDMGAEQAIPGVVAAPDMVGEGPLLLDSGQRHVVLLLNPTAAAIKPPASLSQIMAVTTAPLARIEGGWILPAENWELGGIVLIPTPNRIDSLPVLLFRGQDTGGASSGRMDLYPPVRNDGRPSPRTRVGSWALPGDPVQGVALRQGGRIAVLCDQSAASQTMLYVQDMLSGGSLVAEKPIPLDTGQLGSRAGGIAFSRDGAYLFVLTTGYALDQPSGEETTWLHVFETLGFEAIAPALRLEGIARVADAALSPADDGICWVATRVPGSDFAYATCVRVSEEGLKIVSHTPFGSTPGPLRIAPAPAGEAVAIAADRRLEIWPSHRPGGKPRPFAAPIEALVWTAEALFAGEGGRVHTVDPQTGEPLRTVQLQTGLVTALAPLAASARVASDADGDGLVTAREIALGTSPELADTDGDTIPDGLDPEATVPSPQLVLQQAITFHGEAVGREVRSIVLDPKFGQDLQWRLEYDEAAMPWLRVHPRHGVTPHIIHMGVDASFYTPDPGGWVEGKMTVHLSGTDPQMEAAGSPAVVLLQIAPDRNRIRRILWITSEAPAAPALRDRDTPRPLGALAELLAAPPHRFTHHETQGPVTEALDRYTVVVLQTDALAQGLLTRHALLEYVAEGGSLLLLGKHDAVDQPEFLARWLSPVGIHIAGTTEVHGTFSADVAHELTRNWGNFAIRQGCAIHVDKADAVLVRGPRDTDTAILAHFAHGLGRIVVLAAPTPLETQALVHLDNRRFAAGLFRWLARARQEIHDQDGDGLPDSAERRNVGGKVDFSKTDHLLSDTDGDGIPDNLEDLNRNGWVDEGETSPVNPDSDGDGIYDGADLFPLPPTEAPHVARIEGPEGIAAGPSEGGTRVTLIGRNLRPDTAVWFGDRRASQVQRLDSERLIATTPPFDPMEGGTVAVRAVNASDRLEGTLPSGFTYTQRSLAKLVLQSVGAVKYLYGVYEGHIQVRVEAQEDTWVGLASFNVRVEPAESLKSLQIRQTREGRGARKRLVTRRLARGLHRVGVSPGQLRRNVKNIANLQWFAPLTAENPNLVFTLDQVTIATRNGIRLQVETYGLDISLAGGTVRTRPHK